VPPPKIKITFLVIFIFVAHLDENPCNEVAGSI